MIKDNNMMKKLKKLFNQRIALFLHGIAKLTRICGQLLNWVYVFVSFANPRGMLDSNFINESNK